jgi:hypothetical protein
MTASIDLWEVKYLSPIRAKKIHYMFQDFGQ